MSPRPLPSIPRAFFGRIMGAPGELVDSAKAYAYCRALPPLLPASASSPSENPKKAATSSSSPSPTTREIANLDQLKSATAALADPRKTDSATAEKLIATSRPIYYFNAALHSTKPAPPNPSLNSRTGLAVSDQPMIRRIRENLVVLINPVSNPDGRDNQVQWFYRYLKGKTDRASLPRQAPPYWANTFLWTSIATPISSPRKPPKPSLTCSSIGTPPSSTISMKACHFS